jgi:hypothetical protein
MVRESVTEIRARVAANNIAWLQRELDAEVDKVRHDILTGLLVVEFRRIADQRK